MCFCAFEPALDASSQCGGHPRGPGHLPGTPAHPAHTQKERSEDRPRLRSRSPRLPALRLCAVVQSARTIAFFIGVWGLAPGSGLCPSCSCGRVAGVVRLRGSARRLGFVPAAAPRRARPLWRGVFRGAFGVNGHAGKMFPAARLTLWYCLKTWRLAPLPPP